VNLNQVKTLAELTAALAALPQYCRRDYLGHGQGWEILRRLRASWSSAIAPAGRLPTSQQPCGRMGSEISAGRTPWH
jgi:hypothetical protein